MKEMGVIITSDIIANITTGAIGAIIALLLRELFAWKGQGRIEAINRYETLLTECYGKVFPILNVQQLEKGKFSVSLENYRIIRSIYNRFYFRFPVSINEGFLKILTGDNKVTRNEVKIEIEGEETIVTLATDIAILLNDLISEIRRLESYTQSLKTRIWYIFFVWNFTSKKLLGSY